MISFPNAKINLGLYITEKRFDGFHNLASCFYPVAWQDVLEILPAEKIDFQISGLSIEGQKENNLCLKAYFLLQKEWNIPAVAIHLHKNIPMGAGLGGGSADAAFTLQMLNDLFDLSLTTEQLEQYARQLGSDCAFFIQNKPAYCTQKGDTFQDIACPLQGKYIIIVYPNFLVSTKEAYEGIVAKPLNFNLQSYLERIHLFHWKDTLSNDFENHLFVKYPLLPALKASLYEQGATYASMSGSGSAVYGIFEQETIVSLSADYRVWGGFLS